MPNYLIKMSKFCFTISWKQHQEKKKELMNKSALQIMLLIKILKICKINFRKPFSTKTYPMEQQYLYKHPSHPIAW